MGVLQNTVTRVFVILLFLTLIQPPMSYGNGFTHIVEIKITYLIMNLGGDEVNAFNLGLVRELLKPIDTANYVNTQTILKKRVFINNEDLGELGLNNSITVKQNGSINITLYIEGAIDLDERRRGYGNRFEMDALIDEPALKYELTLVKPMWNYTHPIVALLSEYLEKTLSNPDPLVRLETVLDYIDRNIIYSTSVIPRQPWEVIVEGMGDCDDQSNLLIALLRSMNIPSVTEVGFVYVSNDYFLRLRTRGFNAEYTFKGGFSHAWVLAYVSNLGWIRIDPTVRLAGGGDPWVMVNYAYYYRLPTLTLGYLSGEDYAYTWFTNLNELNVKKLFVNSTVTIICYNSSSSVSS